MFIRCGEDICGDEQVERKNSVHSILKSCKSRRGKTKELYTNYKWINAIKMKFHLNLEYPWTMNTEKRKSLLYMNSLSKN